MTTLLNNSNYASLSFPQQLNIMHPSAIWIILIVIAIIIGLFLSMIFLPRFAQGNVPDMTGISLLALLFAIPIYGALGLVSMHYTAISDSDLMATKTVQIVKVTHVKGSDNYLAYDQAGHKYDIDSENVDIETASHPSAEYSRISKKPGISQTLYNQYKKQNVTSTGEQELDIKLSPKMAKSQTWNFK